MGRIYFLPLLKIDPSPIFFWSTLGSQYAMSRNRVPISGYSGQPLRVIINISMLRTVEVVIDGRAESSGTL